MDLNDEVRKRSAYISRPARPAQPDAQHAGPAAPPGTPSPLPSWSEQPLSAKKSPAKKRVSIPEHRIGEFFEIRKRFAEAKPGEVVEVPNWWHEMFAPKNSGHVSEESCPRCHKELQDQICLNAECFGGRMTSAGWVDAEAVRIQVAVLAERERCAKIADQLADECISQCDSDEMYREIQYRELAMKIRGGK